MKIKSLVAVLAFAAAGSAFADAPAATPQTPEAWLARMSDMTQNMTAYKDPKVFVPFVNAISEPGFYTTMGTMMMDPAGWTKMMGTAMDPNAYRNVAEFADPNIYTKWLAASMDPNFYTALLTQLSDPGKLMRWAMLPADPKMWNMMLQTLNPNMYMKWMMAPLDPRLLQMGVNSVNPALYLNWLGATVDPKSYGPTWGSMMTNPLGAVAPAAGAAPAATPWTLPAAPAGTVNFFDPAVWTNMMAAPLAAIPGAAPAPAAAPAAPAAPAAK